jgi:hypothetical protein
MHAAHNVFNCFGLYNYSTSWSPISLGTFNTCILLTIIIHEESAFVFIDISMFALPFHFV